MILSIILCYSGNEFLYRFTNFKMQQLRVELEKWDGEESYMEYDKFVIGSNDDNFRLSIGVFQGNIGLYIDISIK